MVAARRCMSRRIQMRRLRYALAVLGITGLAGLGVPACTETEERTPVTTESNLGTAQQANSSCSIVCCGQPASLECPVGKQCSCRCTENRWDWCPPKCTCD